MPQIERPLTVWRPTHTTKGALRWPHVKSEYILKGMRGGSTGVQLFWLMRFANVLLWVHCNYGVIAYDA